MMPIIVYDDTIFRPNYHQESREALTEHIEVQSFIEPFRISVPIAQGSFMGIKREPKPGDKIIFIDERPFIEFKFIEDSKKDNSQLTYLT